MSESKEKKVEKTAKQIANEKELKANTEALAKIKKAKSLKEGKVKCVIVEGFGDRFGTDKIVDGSELNLPIETAKALLVKGFITVK